MSFQIAVENIKCGGCASTIRTKLLGIDGVRNVEIDIKAGLVKIDADENLKQQITYKLAQIGYPEVGSVEGLQSIGAKAKSFVSCAVGRMSSEDDAKHSGDS